MQLVVYGRQGHLLLWLLGLSAVLLSLGVLQGSLPLLEEGCVVDCPDLLLEIGASHRVALYWLVVVVGLMLIVVLVVVRRGKQLVIISLGRQWK